MHHSRLKKHTVHLFSAMFCLLFLTAASTEARAQGNSKAEAKAIRKEKRRQAKLDRQRKREAALYGDSDFLDSSDDTHVVVTARASTKRAGAAKPVPKPSPSPRVAAATSSQSQEIERAAQKLTGIPYRYGGMDHKGFDCSGFTCHVFGESGVKIPRTAQAQYDAAKEIPLRKVQKGDLVFFGKNKQRITHVGIVISEEGEPLRIMHSASSTGIAETNVENDSYWKPKLVAAGRYLDRGQVRASR